VVNQVSDQALLAGSSLLAKQLNQRAASALLNIRSRFNGPGVVGFSSEAYVCEPITLLEQGILKTLLASDYASRKLGVSRTPTPAPRAVFAELSGWEILAGATPLADLQAQISSGALVGRLSMGMPAANGDFSGVLKNSFAIESGRQHQALCETMISGNMAQMLNNILGVSQERIDTGTWCLPWLLIDGAHFS
jgi:PmbA protein